ncbi:hypothetical protein Pth03_78320 [Planotetraspora thailandica]|uniref:Uncharacterized protein n=1 Tax=Planotetraspora thailandica TaxID=487172 RepID=A0A8J4DF11_9ACTN|nr:hypothetical protein [Planotetraspora thailandica]GII59443.1 hypothetical protein Pth03_78320 [Planotetraspora thailandica]
MTTAMHGPGTHEDRALETLHENPAMAQVLAILALASAVNRLAAAQEQLADR